MKLKMTYELAMAAAKDEANRQMRTEKRKQWNRADYNRAVTVFNKFQPEQIEQASK